MTISVTHTFVSPKSDDVDATLVRASNWNAEHAITLATGKLLGRGTVGTGAMEEITLGTNLSLSGTTLNAEISDGDKGDVIVSASGATWTVDTDAISYAKMQNVSAASLLIGRGSASGSGDPQEITLGTNLSMSGTTLNVASSAVGATPVPPQGRLTLLTATPVMTTTQSAKTTIYYTPYVGNQVVLYDGSSMVPTTFTELSVVTSDTTKSPAAIGASKVNDWFVWSDAGTVRLGHGPDWTNDITRSAGTALTRVNGILLNSVSITNGPAASRGTYVGTTRSNASSQLDFILGGISANGTAGVCYVWNAYNRRPFAMKVGDSTDSWTYALNSWHSANGSSTMRVSYVTGLEEDTISATYSGLIVPSGSGIAGQLGVGQDSATVSIGTGTMAVFDASIGSPCSLLAIISGLGAHYIQALEQCNTASTVTFVGDHGSPGQRQNGLIVQGWF